jgi:hypothetical protein
MQNSNLSLKNNMTRLSRTMTLALFVLLLFACQRGPAPKDALVIEKTQGPLATPTPEIQNPKIEVNAMVERDFMPPRVAPKRAIIESQAEFYGDSGVKRAPKLGAPTKKHTALTRFGAPVLPLSPKETVISTQSMKKRGPELEKRLRFLQKQLDGLKRAQKESNHTDSEAQTE